MRMIQSVLVSSFLVLASVFPAASQDSAPPTQPASALQPLSQSQPASTSSQPITPPPAASVDIPKDAPQAAAPTQPVATSLNEVIERVIQREHFFLAQMRHMRPHVHSIMGFILMIPLCCSSNSILFAFNLTSV